MGAVGRKAKVPGGYEEHKDRGLLYLGALRMVVGVQAQGSAGALDSGSVPVTSCALPRTSRGDGKSGPTVSAVREGYEAWSAPAEEVSGTPWGPGQGVCGETCCGPLPFCLRRLQTLGPVIECGEAREPGADTTSHITSQWCKTRQRAHRYHKSKNKLTNPSSEMSLGMKHE
ncbi:hypothetical protein NDU88_002207 [Pleurodeles waltl]|uniref:Uncharacterized protein n=1 Tax=Pleurodeles waltl TaxID=8319 RepID=A0AAV7LZV9_PLEWA|nr:hypothetical protein NDU88_002207 [Pleurodeles waltl]